MSCCLSLLAVAVLLSTTDAFTFLSGSGRYYCLSGMLKTLFLCTWVILFKRRHTLFALRSTVSADVGSAAYQVKGDEGLLDTGRMEKAFLGSGVKVPKDKQLK